MDPEHVERKPRGSYRRLMLAAVKTHHIGV